MKILAYPYDKSNPYQSLLYGNMMKAGVEVAFLRAPTPSHVLNLCILPLLCILYRLKGYRTFHLHWTYTFTLTWAGEFGRVIMQGYFYFFLIFLRMLGYRIVWTAHNTLPHERVFYDDVLARRFLGLMSYKVFAHTESGRSQLAEIGINSSKIRIIPHGSYIGSYPVTIGRQAARESLSIKATDTVVLFFGQIRKYKGIETLLESYSAVPDKKKPVLLIAGSVKDTGLAKMIEAYTLKYPRIHALLQYIADDEIQTYFNAADFTVLPYSKSTTSAVALLSSSFGRPVIAPNLAIFSTMPTDSRIIYEDGKLTECLSELDRIPNDEFIKMTKASYAYAESLSWDKIGRLAAEAIK